MVYIQTIDMTVAFPAYMKWLIEDTPIASYNLGISATFAGAVILVLGVYGGVSWLSSRLAGGGYGLGFARFGYAYIFLALAGHLAHNFYHLLLEGPVALRVALENLGLRLSLTGLALSPSLMTALSVGMVLLGLSGGLYALGRMGQSQSGKGWRVALPHMVFMLALGAFYVQMFLLPMNPRHVH
jgi:hypothetical protein